MVKVLARVVGSTRVVRVGLGFVFLRVEMPGPGNGVTGSVVVGVVSVEMNAKEFRLGFGGGGRQRPSAKTFVV